MRKIFAFSALALAALASPALAEASYSGSVSGGFSDPVLSGDYIAVDGSSVFEDDTSTAFVLISPNTDTLTWGSSTTVTPPTPSFSYLFFTPATFSDVAPNTPFELGTIEYQNGTSDLNSLIFGADLTLNFGSGIDPKVIPINIVTTSNTNLSAARDADFIGFGSDIPLTFNVYEGDTAIADLYGEIVGDPAVTLTDLQLDPIFPDAGFIGTGVGSVPEPATWAMMIAGMGLIGGALRRRKSGVRVAFG